MEVLDLDAGRRIVYSWRYGGVPGDSKVSWELAESGEGSRLTFAHTATEFFDTDDPLFSRESCQAGWEYFLNGQPPAFLGQELSVWPSAWFLRRLPERDDAPTS